MGAPQPAAAIVFTTHADGRVTVDGFPDVILLTDAALAAGDPAVVYGDRDRRRLFVAAANGEAEYLMYLEKDGASWRCHRLYARLDPGG